MAGEPKVHVLLVDDDEDLLETVAATLRRHDDVLVTAVDTVAEALDTFDESFVDCIVSDYDMPGMDGIDFLTAVRWHSTEVPFIVMTGYGDESIAAEAVRAGATDYIIKQGDWFADLFDHIQSAVAARDEGKLAHANTRFLRAIDAIEGYGIFLLDSDGRVLTWNDGATDITGYDPESVVGRHANDLFTEGDCATKLLDLARENGEGACEGELVRADDTVTNVHALVTEVDAGFTEPTYFTAVLRET